MGKLDRSGWMVRVQFAASAGSPAAEEHYVAAIEDGAHAVEQVRDALQCSDEDRVEIVHDLSIEDIIKRNLAPGAIRLDRTA